MKHVVMGTAGHIDHGKTTLVKSLTGVDTDRLEEEKRRGMTIELGFAPLTLPSGNVISIVDVPGHEKFIESMVAGATGMDFVVLVIAADEGIKPQTREHLDILSMLEVDSGVVALTKCELASDEELFSVKKDIEFLLQPTPLAGAEIIPVSAVTGRGIGQLLSALEKLTAEAADSKVEKLFRLPIDRVFSMTGYGTVVTGTISGGSISKGEQVDILPGQRSSRIRGIQVHNHQVETATAGDRCALNLSGIDKEDIQRGDVVSRKDMIKAQKLADAIIHISGGKGGLAHNQRVHVHIGSKEVLARVRILGSSQIGENSSGYAQLRFEEPVVALRGDRFIIRAYSPMITLGGGKIIFHETANRKRFSEDSIAALENGAHGDLSQIILQLLSVPGRLASLEEVYLELYTDREILQTILSELSEKGELVYFPETDKYLSYGSLTQYKGSITDAFEDLYKKNRFACRIDREQLRRKVFKGLDIKDFNALLHHLIAMGVLVLSCNDLKQPGAQVLDRILNQKESKAVSSLLIEDGFALRTPGQLAGELLLQMSMVEEIEKVLKEAGIITDLGCGQCVHNDVFYPAVQKIRGLLISQKSARTGEIRDVLSIGRKATITLLEYLDSLEVTLREAEIRKPGVRFMDYFK